MRETLARTTPDRLEVRRGAELRATALLNERAGRMDEPTFRELFALFNSDSDHGRRSAGRFSPAFVGQTANTLLGDVAALNEWTERVWRADVEEALTAIDEVFAERERLRGAGRTYPSILMYLRDNNSWAFWTDITEAGLRALDRGYAGHRGRPTAATYVAFSRHATKFATDHNIAPELLDYVLAAAGRESTSNDAHRSSPSWDEFVGWAIRLYQHEGFDAEERDYKLALAEKVLAARQAFETGGDWIAALARAFGASENNLTYFRAHSVFLDAAREHPPDVETLLRDLWSSEPDAGSLTRAFAGWSADNSPGNQLAIASFLLMAVDPMQYPVFRATPVERAHALLGLPTSTPAPGPAELDLSREYSPEDLAVRIGVGARRIREFLRTEFPRDEDEHGTRWALSAEQVEAVIGRFGRTARDTAATTAGRYMSFLELLDQLASQMSARGVPIRDRLDAQGLLWWVTKADPPDTWDMADRAAFLAFQRGKRPTRVAAAGLLPEATDALTAQLFLPKEWLQRILNLLEEKRQVIFFGPPGTGKTFVAQALAEHLAAAGGTWRLVQFHPSYSYEDFFEGYRPEQGVQGSPLTFSLRPGPLREAAALATESETVPHVLVIDEINRGNIAKIFGELYFLLEYRERAIDLQYSHGQGFSLPKNLFFIGTMNTADRSIALVDSALRRRFYFVPFLPRESPIKDVLRKWLREKRFDEEPARLLEELNNALAERPSAGDEFAIGPSYFISEDGPPNLERVWEYGILPLLEERFYGQLSREQIADELGLEAIRSRLARSDTEEITEEPARAAADEP